MKLNKEYGKDEYEINVAISLIYDYKSYDFDDTTVFIHVWSEQYWIEDGDRKQDKEPYALE